MRIDPPVVVNFNATDDPLTFGAALGLGTTDALAHKLSDLTSIEKVFVAKQPRPLIVDFLTSSP